MQYTVVLVEDNPSDVEVVGEAIKKAGLDVKLRVLTDGAAANDYIHSIAQQGGSPAPDLFILDLNLPWVTGDELLRELRANPKSAGIPVLLTSSAIGHPRYLARMREHGADRVFLKPIEMEGFLQIGPIIREMLEHEPREPVRSGSSSPLPRMKAALHTRTSTRPH